MIFFQIAKNTFRESLREPIFYLLLLTALLLIGLFPSFALFVFREQIKLVSDSSLATTLVFGLLCSVLCASHTVTKEMKNGTVLLLLSKPVPRWSFILAKISGIIAALTIFVITCEAATIVSLRIASDQFSLEFSLFFTYLGVLAAGSLFGAFRNFFAKKAFSSSASMAFALLMLIYAVILEVGPAVHVDDPETHMAFARLLPIFILIIYAIWVMVALTVALSTRLDMVGNLCICSVLFLGGLVSDYFFGREESLFSIYSLIYALLPNWQIFWLVDALASQKIVPWNYVILAGTYTLVYVAFVSFLAVVLFQSREAASDVR